VNPPAGRRRLVLTYVVWLFTFASVVSWRKGAIFTGAFDPTVLAKAAVAILAAGCAVVLWRSAPARRTLSPFPAMLVLAIVAIALAGAYLADQFQPSLVLTARIVLLATTILLLLAVTDTGTAIATALAAMASIGLAAAASGAYQILMTPGARHRLGGGVPQLEPNELATLILPAAIGLTYLMTRRGLRPSLLSGLLVLSGIIVATGSRTALAMLAIGAILSVLSARSMSRGMVVLLLVGVVAAYVMLGFTDVLTNLLLRGEGSDRLGTLNSRTISWDAVFAIPKDSSAWWVGSGLAMKTIAVSGQWWRTQVFDSSWVSSIAQDGLLGTVVLGVYVAAALIAILTNRSVRPYAIPIAITIVLRSFVENGLIESSATFTLFFGLATAAWPGTPALLTPRGRRAAPAAAAVRGERVLVYPQSWIAEDRSGRRTD
jgi:hypothetical protein